VQSDIKSPKPQQHTQNQHQKKEQNPNVPRDDGNAHDRVADTKIVPDQESASVSKEEINVSISVPSADLSAKITQPIKIRNTAPVKFNLEALEVLKQFELVNTVDSYINYTGGSVRLSAPVPYIGSAGMEFFSSSPDLFCPWRVSVRYEVNKEFFSSGKNGLSFVNSVPFSKVGIQDTGVYNSSQGYTSCFNGVMGVLVKVAMDNRVLHDVKFVSLTEANTRGAQNIRSVAVENPKPSLFLASRFTPITWFKRVVDDMVEELDVNYVYGRVDRVNDVIVNASLMNTVACNTDHFYASVMNINAKYLLIDNGIDQRIADILAAYTFEGVVTTFGQITKLTPYNTYDPATMSRFVF